MDSNRFDNWTKNRVLRLSRRNALRLAGIGGVSSTMAAQPLPSLAQSACTLTLHGATSGGPSAPTVYDGALSFTAGADGTFTQATFTPTGGAATNVTGSFAGRALDLIITLSGGKTVTLQGVTDTSGPVCPSLAAGILSGPQPGDLGAWQATGSTATTTHPSATVPSNGGNCPAPSFACGPNCCPGGATCTNTTQGVCTCPNGTTQCGNSCVNNCPNGQHLDLDSCACSSTCAPEGGGCSADTDCCDGLCINGGCETCQFLACPGIGCVDPSFDPNNCGGCGVACSAPTATCTDGACACQVDGMPCTKHFDCCSDSCLASGVCGCAPVGTDCSTFETTCCDNGNSTACIANFCRYIDPLTGHACFTDNECASGICSNGVCMSCIDPGQGPCTRDAECCNYNGLGCVNGVCPQ